MNSNGRSWTSSGVAFVAGVLSTLISVGALSKPAVERIADERAAIVEARLSRQLADIEQARRDEYAALREEISQLRRELITLIKEAQLREASGK